MRAENRALTRKGYFEVTYSGSIFVMRNLMSIFECRGCFEIEFERKFLLGCSSPLEVGMLMRREIFSRV